MKPRIRVPAWTAPMTAEIVRLQVVSTLPHYPITVLGAAAEAELTEVVIMGYRPDGSEYFAASHPDAGGVLWLMERLKRLLVTVEAPPRETVPGGGSILPFTRPTS